MDGNLKAAGAEASTVLDIQNISGSFSDNVRGGNNPIYDRTIRCTADGGRVYCEPVGSIYWGNIEGDEFSEQCSINSNGYHCRHFKNGSYYGQCTFTRATGANGQAYHTESCS